MLTREASCGMEMLSGAALSAVEGVVDESSLKHTVVTPNDDILFFSSDSAIQAAIKK